VPPLSVKVRLLPYPVVEEVEISKPVGAVMVILFVRETAEIEKLVGDEAVPWVVLRALRGPVVEMVTGTGAKATPLKIFEPPAVNSVVGALSLMVWLYPVESVNLTTLLPALPGPAVM